MKSFCTPLSSPTALALFLVAALTSPLFAADKEPAPTPPPAPVVADLDADRNGLYDDAERKLLLDVLARECPEILPEGAPPFDANGDGKVSIQEQSEGRGPLPFLIPRRFLAAGIHIPWSPDIFPEWIATAYLQEDVVPGPVAEHVPRGFVQAPATQVDTSLQPQRMEGRDGIAFAANSAQGLTMPGQRDARWNYRWCLFTFRVDAASSAAETVLLDLNRAARGEGSNKSSPRITFSRDAGLRVQFVGLGAGGLDKRVMTARNVVADGKTWNVLVCGIRYGQMFASVNGTALATETPQPPRFSGEWPYEITSYLGGGGTESAAWAYDALIFGQSEPSEAMVRKMTGWAAHRLGFASGLPADHPYREARPVLDAEDFPYLYVHDNEKWTAWGTGLTKTVTRVNAGGPRVEPQGWERVFYDDFRAPRIKASTSGEGDLWQAPGFNIAVGVDAPLVTPGRKPEVYEHDAKAKKQVLSLANQAPGRWRGSAFYSVNDLGHGYTWRGPKVFRIRCMFPKADQKQLAGGLFPAFWSYDPASLVWRTGNRIEVDWFEFDGKNGGWLNGLSTHLHYPYHRTFFAKNPASYKRYKVYGGVLNEEKSKIPGGLFVWDGQYHTWEFVVDRETTYVNVTITDKDGQEKWVEICRCPTAPTYLENLDLQLDYALKGKNGLPKDGQRQDFVVDFVEVLQRTDALDATPGAPFTARPVLTSSNSASTSGANPGAGVTAAGATITCEANLQGVSDVRYFWFADGYPLTWGPANTYTLTAADAGKSIRCMVKAVGALDMPEAWTAPLK
ncbi:hypothetical protein DB346_13085 [Verrucomicrobia bacterium LW23]|nr:hypothetical protein DB346_13085 [Verrucomicrobia bacterium LW23]